MPLTPGTRVGPYEILAPLGAGGMGEVYRARDTRLNRDIAIKVLPESFAADPDRLARFEREAKAVAALSHPNVLSIFDFGHDATTVYAVMELLDGETLRQKLAGPLPTRKAVEYGVQIARGLAAAHAKGIVHRDLKPENVFVTADGRVKILDFGLARQTLSPSEVVQGFSPAMGGPEGPHYTNSPTIERHTDPGTVLGTVGYMSPEQARGEPGDQRSDLFSFGTVLYQLVSGRRAFQRDTAAETLTAILREDAAELTSASAGGVPPALARVVQHCLEKNSGERFQSASDVAFALENLSGSGATAAQAVSAPPRRWIWLPWAVATGAVIVTAAALITGRSMATISRAVTFVPLTYRQQQVIFNAFFAPDGRTAVFSSATGGVEPEIFMVSAESPEARSIGVRNTQLLAISSKGELAVLTGAKWLSQGSFDGTLARMPLAGGAPREILEHVREADWSPDGERLAIIRTANGRDRLEFPTGTVLYETSGYVSDMRMSPSGDRIAFFDHPLRNDDRGAVAVVDLAGKKTTLSDGYWGLQGLAWSRDGREVLFSGGLSYVQFRVYGVTLDGRLRSALESAGGLTMRDVGADGRWLVTRDDRSRMMMVKPAGARDDLDLSWFDFTTPVSFSADGRTILFTESGGVVGNNYATALRRTDGSPVVRLGEGSAADLSRDGKSALAILPSTPPVVVVYPTGAGETRRLDAGPIRTYDTAAWFPDARHVLTCGSEPSRASRCYMQDLAGPPRAITPDDTSDGLVAPDGRHVLVRTGGAGVPKRGDTKTLLYSIDGGEPRQMPGVTPDDRLLRFAPDGRSIIVKSVQLSGRVERVFLDSGRRELVQAITPPQGGLTNVGIVVTADDPNVYAYAVNRRLSRLFQVQGALQSAR